MMPAAKKPHEMMSQKKPHMRDVPQCTTLANSVASEPFTLRFSVSSMTSHCVLAEQRVASAASHETGVREDCPHPKPVITTPSTGARRAGEGRGGQRTEVYSQHCRDSS